MLLKLLLHYLYWKTHTPHITFFKLCLMDDIFFLHRSNIGHFYSSSNRTVSKQKTPCYKKGKPYFKEITQICNVFEYSVISIFFFLPRSISTNTNYGTVSQHAVRISVRLLGKENIHSLSCTCLFILFAHNWNCIEITQKSFTQKVTCSQMILICLKMKLTLKGKE